METRVIERRAAIFGHVGMLVATVLAAGCAGEPPPQQPVDAAVPVGFAVRGTATGVLGPVALKLHSTGGTELLAVTQDGAFVFETRLETGASYAVTLVDASTPCTLRNHTGVIANTDTAIELTCTGASLVSVVVSGIAPTVTLVPGTTDYVVDLPLSQQSVTLTATVATPGDTLTIAGMPAASGTPSADIALSLGDNLVDIVVENALGWRRTYRLTLRRAAQLAQYAYAKASNTDAEDRFGTSVALSGDTLAVGAPYEDSGAQGAGGNQDDDSVENSGAVYVFRRIGSTWLQEAYLKASNAGTMDHFGTSVALLGDTLAVGAPDEASAAQGIGGDQDDDSALGSGAVYVFRRAGTAWLQEAYIKASNTDAWDQFGASVALSGDTLAVGAPWEDSAAQGVGGNQDDDSVESSGAVYMFQRTGTAWLQDAYIKASNPDVWDHFGTSLALSGDTLAVGAPNKFIAVQGGGGNQDKESAPGGGSVYVFRRAGMTWLQEAYIKASSNGVLDLFGISVALSSDTLAVGASAEDSGAQSVGGNQDDDSVENSGAVYVFRRIGAAWRQDAYLVAFNADVRDRFGTSVALSDDTLAVGASGEVSAVQGVGGNQGGLGRNRGSVYVFRRIGTAWLQDAYLVASNTRNDDEFGASVALSDDTLVVGAPSETSAAQGVGGNQDDDSAAASGAVYIFH